MKNNDSTLYRQDETINSTFFFRNSCKWTGNCNHRHYDDDDDDDDNNHKYMTKCKNFIYLFILFFLYS